MAEQERVFSETVSQALRGRREELGLSQEELASLAGVHRNTIGKLERDEANPNILVLSSLLIAMGANGVGIDEGGWAPIYERTTGVDVRALYGSMRPPSVIAEIGHAIRRDRQGKGASLGELSSEAGVHPNSLWSLESGLVVPSSDTVLKLYRALGVRRVAAGEEGLVLD